MAHRHSGDEVALYEIRLAQAEHVAAHKAGDARPVDEAENQNDVPEAGTENCCRHEHDQDVWKGHDHIRKTHDEHVCDPSKVACDQPKHDADHRRDQSRQCTDEQ